MTTSTFGLVCTELWIIHIKWHIIFFSIDRKQHSHAIDIFYLQFRFGRTTVSKPQNKMRKRQKFDGIFSTRRDAKEWKKSKVNCDHVDASCQSQQKQVSNEIHQPSTEEKMAHNDNKSLARLSCRVQNFIDGSIATRLSLLLSPLSLWNCVYALFVCFPAELFSSMRTTNDIFLVIVCR